MLQNIMAKFSLIVCKSVIAAIALISAAYAQDSGQSARPKPPTNLRVFDVGSPAATVNTLNIFLDQSGALLSGQDRAVLEGILDKFSDSDLQSLADGIAPEAVGIKRSNAITETAWRPLVGAYARAKLIDRSRTADRAWSFFMLLVGCVLGVLATIAFEHLVKKRPAS